ncbi:GDSL esterase/lipase At1g31550-like [Fagus crenata]
MAPYSSLLSLKQKLPFIKLLLLLATIRGVVGQCYTSVFGFGDSLVDTGNIYFLDAEQLGCLLPPYGETYFHHPTGRCIHTCMHKHYSSCNYIYRSIFFSSQISFVSESLGLQLVQPYLGIKNRSVISIQEGINFAVAGATALNASFFVEKGIDVTTNISLKFQLDWFKEILPSLCNTSSSKLAISSWSSSYS